MTAADNEEGLPPDETGLFRNSISLVGGVLAVIAAANIAFLAVVDFLTPAPYLGIFAYMVLPAVMILGLILIPIGMFLERRRRRSGAGPQYPHLDLNDPRQRTLLASVGAFTIVFVALSAAGSYQAYQVTDSVQFCGTLCHTVMAPEYTAYTHSPHARVRCVDCHVGSGASWFVRSKLSGSYQVYAVTFRKYPRPIPTPVHNLRPAQQTCEECHWPRRFYGAQLKVFTHYSSDEKNTPRQIRMLLNIGGAEPLAGVPSGIHWHMNIANRITYITTDEHRQVIPWVQVQDQQGKITVYQAKDSPLKPDQIEKSSRHLMDCIDCHNRPTHIFNPPDQSVDNAITAHLLDASIPFVKQQAVAALTKTYDDENQAMKGIANDLTQFYSSKYPQIYNSPGQPIKAAVTQVQQIYANTIFPYMKVDWRTHPANIGHFYFPGCFRCHDGNHVSADGKVITKNCNACHTVLSELESGAPLIGSTEGVSFKHPVDIGDLSQVSCSDCHTGGTGP
jgi:nitrate/TMAO reductase-like tetraheme cytochrome c subunit